MEIQRMFSSTVTPFRKKRPTTNKLIFISCEGSVTEWEYFEKIINLVFVNISSKVKIINVLEDVLKKSEKIRTSSEKKQATSCDPKNLLKKMDDFKNEHNDEYDFANHTDEFWLIMDIDDHTNATIVDCQNKSNLDKWNAVLQQCRDKNYQYAVSNPFFELWLLLHFDNVNKDDYSYAVTASHAYATTDHYRDRLSSLGIKLNGKHIRKTDYHKYSKSAVFDAISRAEALDPEPKCDYPTDLGSTVYRLLKSIAEIDAQYEIN